MPAALSRDEKIHLLQKGIRTEDDFLDKAPSDFRGTISPRKAEEIITKINEKRKRNHEYWLREHRRRLDAAGFRFSEVEDLYTKNGRELEAAIQQLFALQFAACTATRITTQREAEPDHLLVFEGGKKLAVQTTAKVDNKHFVDSKKSGDVIPQSARFAPDGYICFGRPDFQSLAKEQAKHQGKQHNFKLIPIFALAELYVRYREGKLKPPQIATFLLDERGYLDVQRIDAWVQQPKS